MERFVENCKISQRFEVSRQMLDKIGVQLCENFYCLKKILISFHMFLFHQKIMSGLLKLCYFKVYNIWISPLKTVNDNLAYPSELMWVTDNKP